LINEKGSGETGRTGVTGERRLKEERGGGAVPNASNGGKRKRKKKKDHGRMFGQGNEVQKRRR